VSRSRSRCRAPVSFGSALLLAVLGCAPEDVYLFERASAPDAGASEPAEDVSPAVPDAVVPDEPAAPVEPVQPACESEACEVCVDRGNCAGSALPLCHPVGGQCVAGCEPSAGDAPGNCPGASRCDLELAVCVECLASDDCQAPTPACDVPSGTCVPCVGRADCALPAPVCDTRAFECVGCVVDDDCAATGDICQESARRCVECESDADCLLRREPGDDDDDDDERICSPELRCVECRDDDDCALIDPERPFCSPSFECEDERE
jgi:hypothetical protein